MAALRVRRSPRLPLDPQRKSSVLSRRHAESEGAPGRVSLPPPPSPRPPLGSSAPSPRRRALSPTTSRTAARWTSGRELRRVKGSGREGPRRSSTATPRRVPDPAERLPRRRRSEAPKTKSAANHSPIRCVTQPNSVLRPPLAPTLRPTATVGSRWGHVDQ